MRPTSWFEANRWPDAPMGAIERLLLTDSSLKESVNYVIGDLVMVRSFKHLKEELRGVLGQIEQDHAMSGVYTVCICRTNVRVALNRYELVPALPL